MKSKRPVLISIISIYGLVSSILGLIYSLITRFIMEFSKIHVFQTDPNANKFLVVELLTPIFIVGFWGIWKMKRWGFYTLLGAYVFFELYTRLIIDLSPTLFSSLATLIPLLITAIYFKKLN